MQELTTTGQSLIDVIARAASDPSVDVAKMESLLAMQERVLEHEREIALQQALARLEPLIETLVKSKFGAKTKGGDAKFKYTPYEDIDRMLRPKLRSVGLTLDFTTREVGGKPWYVARVTENTRGGFRESMMPYAPDSNSQLNTPQQIASGLSYCKRYVVSQLFNLVSESEDDDGEAVGYISQAQASELEEMLKSGKVDTVRFMRFVSDQCGANSLNDIPRRSFNEIKSKLTQKINS